MSHAMAKVATSREMAVIARMTTAEQRAGDPTVLEALGDGLELIRVLIASRDQRHDLDDRMDDARADDFGYDPPCHDE